MNAAVMLTRGVRNARFRFHSRSALGEAATGTADGDGDEQSRREEPPSRGPVVVVVPAQGSDETLFGVGELWN